jgi:gentisate 1,2-dioxygenase
MKSEVIAALAARVVVEVSCGRGERAAVRHRPLEARPRTVVSPLFEYASQAEAMALERKASVASVAPVVKVYMMQKMQWGLPKTVTLAKAMAPNSLGGDHRRRRQWPLTACFREPLG